MNGGRALAGLLVVAMGTGALVGCGEDEVLDPYDPEFEAIIEEFLLAPLPDSPPYPPNNPFNADRERQSRWKWI